MFVMLRVALPPLVSVTVCAAEVVVANWSLNAMLLPLRVAAGAAAAVAVPVRVTVRGLSAALSVMGRDALRAVGGAEVGLNLTAMVQLAPIATVVPQLLV